MNFFDLLLQLLIGHLPRAGWAFKPGVVTTPGNLQHPTHHRNLEFVPVSRDELIFHRGFRVKIASAFFKMSRSCSTIANSRSRPRTYSSSAFKRPLPGKAWTPSRSTSLRQLYRLPRLSPNSRSNWLSVLPLLRANSIVSNLNSLLYFGCFLGIFPSLFSILDFLYVY